MKNKNKNHIVHTPVMAQEVIDVLKPQKGENYLDLTAGYGGHASLILESTGITHKSLLCDRDQEAIEYLNDRFEGKVMLKKATFYDACTELIRENRQFDMILADLGVSSPHLDKANRGFSIVNDGPLDMRMDQSQGISASEYLESVSEKELETVLRVYGEEPKARRIAAEIIQNRPFATTGELAAMIKRVYGTHTKHHPAVRSFQAIRIAVNDELGLLEKMLPLAVNLLKPHGRLGIITFHSLEDRIVKQYFADRASWGFESDIKLLTKKALIPTPHEISFNPRARSAKLRAVVKK